jgi:hypothetical protein
MSIAKKVQYFLLTTCYLLNSLNQHHTLQVLTVDKLKKSLSSRLVNVFTFAANGTLVVVLLLPLSFAMDSSEFNHGGGGGGSGGGGGPVAAAATGMAVVEDRDWWRWHLMVAAALDGGHVITSRCSKWAAQREDKRQGSARGGNATTS